MLVVGKRRERISGDGDSGSFGCWPMNRALRLCPFHNECEQFSTRCLTHYLISSDVQYRDSLPEESICSL